MKKELKVTNKLTVLYKSQINDIYKTKKKQTKGNWVRNRLVFMGLLKDVLGNTGLDVQALLSTCYILAEAVETAHSQCPRSKIHNPLCEHTERERAHSKILFGQDLSYRFAQCASSYTGFHQCLRLTSPSPLLDECP